MSLTFIEDTQQAIRDMESQLPDHMSTTSEEASEDEADDSIFEDVTLGANEVAGSEINRTPFRPSSGNVQVEPHLDGAQDQEQPSIHKYINEAAIQKKVQLPSSQHSAVSVNSADKETSEVGHLEAPAHRVDFHTLPSVVCPPAPEVTVMSPGTLPSQITPYLQKLKQQNPGRFKPKPASRALEVDERGHWRVDCRLWPKHVQQQFWIFLQKDIESGRLGWGITLHRDAVRMRLGLVRLYCWGELVEHVWLALWLHSGGRVWSTGAVWLDAEELEVISIP
ncbi:uncharacterized protein N0V89_011703 [Didymosphaeria variabile]|uniref:Uncharacterized protein n=1 Tax=Didymosphaeria variabile TaxID=1932322 RepID=A0A9W9C5L9_9PLEO|nr:uncharacterized protein N0V89_011703 [Didymosphaeria variabile]KAJ4345570.1 hypothetical protein N0V89_011703 [Didymosphaeria variabile]